MAPWELPLLVLAIAVPIVAAVLLGGPEAGLGVGGMAGAVLVWVAVRMRPRGGIGTSPSPARRRRLLVVVSRRSRTRRPPRRSPARRASTAAATWPR